MHYLNHAPCTYGCIALRAATWHDYSQRRKRAQHMAHLSTRLASTAARLVLAIVLIACCQMANITAWAGDFEDGVAAAQKGDFATALRLWKPLAEQGNSSAQYNLGLMYDNGQGVAQDYKTAVKWYTLAAEQGIADAQTNLGAMYQTGHGVAQDYKTAVKWYTLAAEQGNAKAQTLLGVMYSFGQGVAQDYKTAVKWYTLAAEQGNAKAQILLGAMYETGQGVAQDYVKAHTWFNISAIDGDADAIKFRDDVAKKMTSAQIEKAQQLATRCMKSSYKDCD